MRFHKEVVSKLKFPDNSIIEGDSRMARRVAFFVLPVALLAFGLVLAGCKFPGNEVKGSYIISYNLNGGSGTAPSPQKVNAGSGITLPPDSGFSKPDCTFGGWNAATDGTGVNYGAGSVYTPAGDITLFAKWDDDGGEEGPGPGGGTGTDETTPEAVLDRLEKYMPRDKYETLFTNRYGSDYWKGLNPGKPAYDYYSYDNLRQAVKEMANLIYTLEVRDDNGVPSTWNYRSTVYNKTTGISKVIFEEPDFDASWNQSKPIHLFECDYGAFLGEGTENDRRREMAGFLASTIQETSAGTGIDPPDPSLPNQSGDRFDKGLFYNEELGHDDNSPPDYFTASEAWPPTPGKSYHGRGPKQLSWNYNYGHFSATIYQDRQILLDNPQLLVKQDGGGVLGWKSAIWFWMTAQTPKPASHVVMLSSWKPNSHQASHGWVWGLGSSIMIINGGLEKGFYEGQDFRVDTRIDAYRKIAAMIGADISGEKLDTGGMREL